MNQATLGISIKEIKHFETSVLIKGYNKRSYKKKGTEDYVDKFLNVEFFLRKEDFDKLKLEIKDTVVVSGKAEMKSEQSKDDENKFWNSVQIHFPSVQKVWFGYGHPNHITFTGNIGTQKIGTTESGARYNTISVAVDGGKQKDSNERHTWWFACFIRGEKDFADENQKMKKGKITIEGEIGERAINATSFWFKPSDEEHAVNASAQANESIPQEDSDDLPF